MQTFKKGYTDLVRQVAGEVKVTRRKSVADLREWVEREGSPEQLECNVQLLADNLEKVVRLQAQMTSKDMALTAACVAGSRSTMPLDPESQAHVLLKSELNALQATRGRREGLLRNIAENVCTGYSGLTRSHAITSHDRLESLLSDA